MTDAGQREPSRRPPPFRLPDIRGLRILRTAVEPRRLRHIRSALDRFDEAIEFRVETDAPLPVDQDVAPVLYVGDTMVTELRPVDERTYAFVAFDERPLERGAPIALAYPNTPPDARARTAFRYDPPEAQART